MKKILLVACLLLLVLSCNKSKKKKTLLDSSGKINNISVIIDNGVWDGRVGDAVRDILASPIYGLPQDEPMFNINQIPPSVFSGFIKMNRTLLKIELEKPNNITFKDNVYAQPQKVITVSGKKKEDVIKLLKDNTSRILETFKNIELKEKQRLMRKVLYKGKVLKEKLGVDIEFPSFYRVRGKEEDSFFWIIRDINTGSLNLIVYELPLERIKRNDSVISEIVKIRDSIGEKYIPGVVDGSYMVTEYNYTPFHSEIILDNKPALETKGLWDAKNAFMSGPYINYAIEDKINNRWLIAEGFVFAPSVEKRDFMFELEAIIKSISIN